MFYMNCNCILNWGHRLAFWVGRVWELIAPHLPKYSPHERIKNFLFISYSFHPGSVLDLIRVITSAKAKTATYTNTCLLADAYIPVFWLQLLLDLRLGPGKTCYFVSSCFCVCTYHGWEASSLWKCDFVVPNMRLPARTHDLRPRLLCHLSLNSISLWNSPYARDPTGPLILNFLDRNQLQFCHTWWTFLLVSARNWPASVMLSFVFKRLGLQV